MHEIYDHQQKWSEGSEMGVPWHLPPLKTQHPNAGTSKKHLLERRRLNWMQPYWPVMMKHSSNQLRIYIYIINPQTNKPQNNLKSDNNEVRVGQKISSEMTKTEDGWWVHPTTKGVMELDCRSQDCTVCNTIRMRSKMRTMLKPSFLDTKMMVKFSENARNKSETMGELNSLFLC